jgi:hypothetical protein
MKKDRLTSSLRHFQGYIYIYIYLQYRNFGEFFYRKISWNFNRKMHLSPKKFPTFWSRKQQQILSEKTLLIRGSMLHCYFYYSSCIIKLYLIYYVRLSVRDGARVRHGRTTGPGPALSEEESIRSAAAPGAPPPCSDTGFHPPGLIHPVYWPVLGSQSLLNPRDHPRYLPPYPIDRTRPGPEGYRRVSRERARLPRPPLHFPLESVYGDKQGRAVWKRKKVKSF